MPNLATHLTNTAKEHGDRPAVKLDDTVLTYTQLQDGARRVAALLESKGVEPGDRIGMVLPNVPHFPVIFYGAVAAGAVVVPMNPLLKGHEVEYYLRDSGASLLFAWQDMAEEATKGAQAVDIECIPVEAQEFLELLGEHEPDNEVVDRADDDTMVLLYTSGTTGQPKGAELTHHNMISNALTSADPRPRILRKRCVPPMCAISPRPARTTVGGHSKGGSSVTVLPSKKYVGCRSPALACRRK